MIPADLRARVIAALNAENIPLGTAVVGGIDTPALVIGDWPEGTTVRGLEVVISATPTQETIPAFEFVGFLRAYPVRLINWSGQENLEDASNALAAAFWPLAEDPALIRESADYPEQVTLSLTVD